MNGQSNVLAIIGMHRSGTSAVSNWLESCGLHIGDRLLGGNTGNEKGHFEDIDFFNLHREILGENGLDKEGFISSRPNVSASQLKKIQQLIRQKRSSYQQWGWKEPRTTLFLKEYVSEIQDVKFLFLFRNFEQVVTSLIKREAKHFGKSFRKKSKLNRIIYFFLKNQFYRSFEKTRWKIYSESWILYNKQILDSLELIPLDNFILVEIEDIISHPKEIFHKILDWGFDLKFTPFEEIFEAALFSKKINKTPIAKDILKEAARIEQKLKENKTKL